jgi:hypothetical protein
LYCRLHLPSVPWSLSSKFIHFFCSVLQSFSFNNQITRLVKFSLHLNKK